jgi:SAM-dependent methyltransferase
MHMPKSLLFRVRFPVIRTMIRKHGLSAKKPPLASEADIVLERRRRRVGPREFEIESTKGAHWQNWPRRRREAFVKEAVRYWRSKGFPYYALTEEEIRRELAWLKAYDASRVFVGDEIIASNLGLRLANYFHPQMWHVQCTRYLSPFEAFSNDAKLGRAIRRALTIWPDRFGANGSSLRRILRSFSNTVGVSNFRPTVAAAIIQRYSPPGGRVLDFAAGYGGRLLGAQITGRAYYGIDPSISQVKGLTKMVAACRMAGGTPPAVIRRGAAETLLPRLRSASFDLVFSSPPYFDREKYGSEPEQSFLRYPTLEEWRERFLRRVIDESARLLAPKGHLVLNVSEQPEGLAATTLAMARRNFLLNRIWKMRLAKLPYKRSNRSELYKWEPILVFGKRVR